LVDEKLDATRQVRPQIARSPGQPFTNHFDPRRDEVISRGD
jgi:hypothetical protein